MRNQYFRTIKGFIVLPEDWKEKEFFLKDEKEFILDQSIFYGGTPVLIDEYDLNCVPIKKQAKAIISEDEDTVLYINSGKDKTIGYIQDYGVYKNVEDAIQDIIRSEYTRVYNAVISQRGGFYKTIEPLADLGYAFDLKASERLGDGVTIWHNNSTNLKVYFNTANTITKFILDFLTCEYEKELTAKDYNVTDEYAKTVLGLDAVEDTY